MENALIVFQQICIMIFYLAIGLLLFHTRLITLEGSKSLANLLLYVVLPAAVLNSFCVERSSQRVQMLIVSILGSVGVLGISMLLSHLMFKKDPLNDFGVAFSNAGFMGIPLVIALLGEGAVFYSAGLVAMMGALQWTYGQYLISGDQNDLRPEVVLKNPLVLSLAGGLLIFFLNIPTPAIVKSTLSSIAALNAPLAMIILGVYLGQTNLRRIFADRQLYLASIARLIVIPLLTFFALQLIPAAYSAVYETLFVCNCAPVACNVAVYAQKKNADYPHAVGLICLSTLFALITMPLMMLLL